jgi:hypothetical protein
MIAVFHYLFFSTRQSFIQSRYYLGVDGALYPNWES